MEKGVFYMHANGEVKQFPASGDLQNVATLLEKMPNVLRAWVSAIDCTCDDLDPAELYDIESDDRLMIV